LSRPTARPIASSQPAENPRSGPPFGPVRAAKDSQPSSPSSRISRAQLDLIAARLTSNDQAVLRFLAQVRLATGQHLARRLWQAAGPGNPRGRAARRALAGLEHWHLIQRLPRRVGGVRGGSASIVYGLGPAGRRLLNQGGQSFSRLGAPGDRYVAHTLAITELVVGLHEADHAGRLDLVELATEPGGWRPYAGASGARHILKPDLFLRIGVGAYEDRWFVEVDLATEAGPTITAKAGRYLDHFRAGSEQRRSGIYPRVIWSVPDQRRAGQIHQALDRLPTSANRLFVVWPHNEVIGRISAEAQQ
jgi:hypothetical protein